MINPVWKLAEQIAFHSVGIVPIENLWADYNRYLTTLSPDEQRKMKRKFRKLWRKFAKSPTKGTTKVYIDQMGIGVTEPTKAQKRARKAEVARRIRHEVVRPIREKMLSADTTKGDSL